jgi:flagellar biosynthesis GTPase FlhF
MNRLSLRPALVGALMLLAQLAPQFAHAQYSWLDANGTRVFSDRPPPPGTPPGRILKAPRRFESAALDAAPAAANDAAPAPADKPKQPSLAEREADYRKRQIERQADEKKAQDEAARKAAQQAMCANARQEERQLASGMRISEMGADGERGYISDEDRARRLARAREALADCR